MISVQQYRFSTPLIVVINWHNENSKPFGYPVFIGLRRNKRSIIYRSDKSLPS